MLWGLGHNTPKISFKRSTCHPNMYHLDSLITLSQKKLKTNHTEKVFYFYQLLECS